MSKTDLASARNKLEAHMARHGLRSTEQRRVIVEEFLESAEHVSIEELLGRARHKDPRIGYATVYRTLKLLVECGIANERKFVDGFTRYELAEEDHHHDHIICLDCGRIVEFEEPRFAALELGIAQGLGFEIRTHKHELYCHCVNVDCPHRRSLNTAPGSDP